ncbi:hypothetical protein PYW07_004192 [Mythimna separata]|uniref:Uncharacterized protein n=1 Tax=Mythimna separata TaxID=271217 RepID=A0AAD8DTT6_MYTSE|nr:hypothetical protein PYW07_004192 [Mythimna separata]
MLSKFIRSTYRTEMLLARKITPKVRMNVRYADMIPATQYDIPFPRKLKLSYTLKTYWEIIPLFLCTATAVVVIMFGSIIWSCKNKVDVVFTSRSRDNISRTMDLRNPSIHKLIIINQRYEPWYEMADTMDKLRDAEKRAMMRAQSCAHP